MEAAFGRLHNSGAAFGRPTVVDSIYVDGKAVVVALQPAPTPEEGQDFQ